MMNTYRLEPALEQGNKGWRVDVCTGDHKKGTFRAVPVTESAYTLAQAKMFCSQNRASDFKHLLDELTSRTVKIDLETMPLPMKQVIDHEKIIDMLQQGKSITFATADHDATVLAKRIYVAALRRDVDLTVRQVREGGDAVAITVSLQSEVRETKRGRPRLNKTKREGA